MVVPSDISPAVETLQIAFFYTVGSVSLIVNTGTLFIIILNSAALAREVKVLSVFQQLSCLLANAYFTLLFIPFFYTGAGAGYCVGVLCLYFPYEYICIVESFFTMTMFSAFGMMIIARHQLLMEHGSALKMRPFVRYATYVIIYSAMHLVTVVTVLALQSDRASQNYMLNFYPQLKWRERGLNWFLFYGAGSPALRDFSYYGFFVLLPVICAFIVLPFAHMAYIVLRARKENRSIKRHKIKHIRPAQTIVIQGLAQLVCLGLPLIPGVCGSLQKNIYADTQTSIVIAEMVFVCSTLINSVIIVSRTHVYRSMLTNLIKTPPILANVSVTSAVKNRG